MSRAIFLTAYNRPNLLQETLASWAAVRGLEAWHFVFRTEPGEAAAENVRVFQAFIDALPHSQPHEIIVNPRCYGVLTHPWVGFTELFADHDFVVRAEDDLRVSDDLLDYFSWADLTFRARPEVGSIHGFGDTGTDHTAVAMAQAFNPWVWGTWRDRWETYLRDTWDHDYSSGGAQDSGWDWNLTKRVYPKFGLHGIFPQSSRVDNIGVFGVHGTPENHRTAESFRLTYGFPTYQEILIR